MNYGARLKKLAWFFGCLGILIVGTVFYRMLWQTESLSNRVYVDRPMTALMEDLAREGVITSGEEGVVIDEKGLRDHVDSPGVRQFVLRRKPYMFFVGDRLEIDPTAVTVTNRRLIQGALKPSRGSILDRNMKVLAETTTVKEGNVQRRYPLGAAALPLLGVAHRVYGQKGLERYLSAYLEGKAEEGLWGRLYRFFTGKKAAYDVILTIDSELQSLSYKALGGKPGAVALMDARSGEVLVAASSPSFDPSTAPGPVWDEAAEKGYKGPFVNRAFQRRYPPGSTYKLVTATAWMEQPDFDKKWGLECKGRHPRYGIREHGGKHHGWVGLETAIRLSCNVFFAEVGVRLGQSLMDCAERFGFNHEWTLLEGAASQGIIMSSKAFQRRPGGGAGKGWTTKDFTYNPKLVAQAAVGQNVISATPLEMAMVGAALGNQGRLMAPLLIKDVKYVKEGPEKQRSWFSVKSGSSEMYSQVCSPGTAREILDMMAGVLDTGTGHSLKKIYRDNGRYRATYVLPEDRENVLVGKTGTAETGKGKADHSWFVAVAPVAHPQYSVAVVVEHGGLGARVAGPIAVEVMLAALNRE